MPRLSETQVRWMRVMKRRNPATSYAVLAAVTRVSKSAAFRAVRGLTWSHLRRPAPVRTS